MRIGETRLRSSWGAAEISGRILKGRTGCLVERNREELLLNQIPETRDSLLVRLADAADHEAWCRFAAIYRPLVYRIARRQGLQDADAQDLTQRVLLSVSRAIEGWQTQPKRAKFRTWLHTVAKNAVIDQLRAANLVVGEGGTTF